MLGPLGRTFFQERGDAFLGVRVEHILRDDVAGEGVGVLGCHLGLGVKGGFAVANGGGEFGGDGLCKSAGCLREGLGGGGLVDQAESPRL